MSILALAAGKHVYEEKPCSHNPYEGELLTEAVHKYRRVLQMGAQRRSFPNIQEAITAVQGGIIGKAYFGHYWPIVMPARPQTLVESWASGRVHRLDQ